MRSKFRFFTVICFVVLGMLPGKSALAADSSYVWTGSLGGNILIDFNSKATYDVYLVDLNGPIDITSNAMKLTDVSQTTNSADWNVSVYYDLEYVSNTLAGIQLKRNGSSDYVDLGTSLNFGFVFVQNGNIYDMYTVGTNTGNGWTVTKDTQSFIVSGNGVASASPVPIPGAAVLLGSGVIGLVGIGSRKKRA